MMLQIGNKQTCFLEAIAGKKSGRDPQKGFTLLEVMITAAVLALGATLIYQSFFIAIDSFNYYSTSLKITPWMDEKIWQAQNELKHSGSLGVMTTSGQAEINNKSVDWSLGYNSVGSSDNLFKVDLMLSWSQGLRQIKLSRSTYAIYSVK
ncbi:MAG: prepilin-type N-terminal cleavage/methylation domain-containing protein [Candidatus Omnitrophica bacterium]|nr:prepilin-type N-terminal cleavage/methylation domain-containing protein [Candidatus Omnitrophota bacterium]